MSIKRFNAKRDATEPEILRALVRAGAFYLRLDTVDLLVLFRGDLFLLDCKTARGRATKTQEALITLGWPLHYVRTPIEALKAIGAVQ